MIFIISGPSGSGKTTLVNNVLKQARERPLFKPVSYTTRLMRQGEAAGRDYYFIGEEEFQSKVESGEFLEWIRYSDNFYGTSKQEILKAVQEDRDVILSIDVRGALALKEMYPKDTVLIFIMPPSLGELEKRILQRCKDVNRDDVAARLTEAGNEMSFAQRYDYRIENNNIDLATRQLSDIIAFRQNMAKKG